MRAVALLSGGKDSLYTMYKATLDGHEVVAIANLKPPDSRDELDSYMYQTVGHQAIELIAEALNKPLYRASITGDSDNKELDYENNKHPDDEVEQLYELLRDIKTKHDFDAITVGAIESSYQKSRVENICKRLNLTMIAPLWKKDQDELLNCMIQDGFKAILIKVACLGLNKNHVGKSIKELQPLLKDLHNSSGTNICGEGGEYETLVLDCPLFKKQLVIEEHKIICLQDCHFAPVYYMRPTRMCLVDKVVAS